MSRPYNVSLPQRRAASLSALEAFLAAMSTLNDLALLRASQALSHGWSQGDCAVEGLAIAEQTGRIRGLDRRPSQPQVRRTRGQIAAAWFASRNLVHARTGVAATLGIDRTTPYRAVSAARSPQSAGSVQ